MSLRHLGHAGPALAFLLAAACVTDVPPPQQTLWETELEGAPGHETVTGTAAALSAGRVTRASIAVDGLPSGTYIWRIFEGDCGAPGNLLGVEPQYPDLVVTEGIGGGVTADSDPALGSEMASGQRYHVAVRNADTSDAVACGEFRERQ